MLPSHMTLAAHKRAFFLPAMAVLAIEMKSLHQSGPFPGRLEVMAIRATLIFRRFILQQVAVLIIDMMAQIAVLDLCQFIVFIMLENGRRSLGVVKNIVIDKLHVFLRIRHNDRK